MNALIKSCCTFTVLFLFACASSSFFISYPEQFIAIKNLTGSGQALQAAQKLERKGKGPNVLLDTLESAHLAQMAGDTQLSKQRFNQAFAYFQESDERAQLSLSEGGELIGSLALNDNAFRYQAEAYERIFAIHFQSFNYLADKNIEGALIEIRRANEEQEFALEKHHKDLVKAEQKATQEGISANPEQFQKQMAENFKAANQVKNSFQNAYTFYYSALIREAGGDLNGAYIDFKRALGIYPDNNYIQQNVWRLANNLHMNADLQRFQSLISEPNKNARHKHNVIIFYEEGFIPEKAEIFLPFSTYERIYSFAFPTYITPWQASAPVAVYSGKQKLAQTETIIDTHALAAKALQEGAFSRLLRQMLRVNTKARLQREAYQENNLTGFMSNVYSLLSERADLRSWLSLPRNVQIAHFSLPPGSHKIHLGKSTLVHEIDVSIAEGETTLIRISNPMNQHIYHSMYTF